MNAWPRLAAMEKEKYTDLRYIQNIQNQHNLGVMETGIRMDFPGF